MTRKEYGDFLFSQLPKSNKHGHMITKEGDLTEYLYVYFSSILFFFGMRLFWDFLFTKTLFRKDFYVKMD